MQPKTTVSFRFKSWALIPTNDHWSNWTHCNKSTMLEFLKVLNRIDEHSNAHLSPDYASKYRAVEEVQVISGDGSDDEWTWTPERGWFPTPQPPWLSEIPKGKGKRPPKKSKAQREAEYQAGLEEIFGHPDDLNQDDITTGNLIHKDIKCTPLVVWKEIK